MTQKEMTQDFAFQEFDACLAKHAKKIKNVLYTIVGHAYNEGYKEGLKQVKSTDVESDALHIEVGDVFIINKDSTMFTVIDIRGEDALVLYDDMHTGLYALELLEYQEGCKRIEEKMDIKGQFYQLLKDRSKE